MRHLDVLLIGPTHTKELQMVCDRLWAAGATAVILDQGAKTFPWKLKYCPGYEASAVLEGINEMWDLSHLNAAWLFRGGVPVWAYTHETDRTIAQLQWQGFWSSFLSVIPGSVRWLNHPHRQAAVENSKAEQLSCAACVGLLTPATLITNSLTQAKCFAKTYPTIIKLLGPTTKGLGAFRTRSVTVSDLDNISDGMPMLLQERIDKRADIRIVYVNGRTFTVKIASQIDPATETDWRHTKVSPFMIPDALDREVASKIIALMDKLGLVFGVIDLALRRDGQYVFFEVNPQGHWAQLAMVTRQEIALAIADYLRGKD